MLAGDIELLKFLLSKEVNVDSQSDAGTPLIWAAGHGQQDSVKVLLEHNANVSLWVYQVEKVSCFCFFGFCT